MIKYRVWDKKQNKYLHPDTVSISGDGILTVVGIEGKYHMSVQPPNDLAPRFIIEQYTDLYELSGGNVCQNDILQYYIGPDYYIGHVVWIEEESSFGMRSYIYDKEYELPFCQFIEKGVNLGDIKVIGNIHDNAELLEKSI